MSDLESHPFPSGLHLLQRWQAGEPEAKQEMTEFFDAAIAGEFDVNFQTLAPTRQGAFDRIRPYAGPVRSARSLWGGIARILS